MNNAWKCLPVREFFSECNWEQTALVKSAPSQVKRQQFLGNWKCLTVRDFFALQNWTGKAAFTESVEATNSIALDFGLTLPVKQFWQCFNWSGEKASPAPELVEQIIEETEEAIAQVQDFSFNDLSQLF